MIFRDTLTGDWIIAGSWVKLREPIKNGFKIELMEFKDISFKSIAEAKQFLKTEQAIRTMLNAIKTNEIALSGVNDEYTELQDAYNLLLQRYKVRLREIKTLRVKLYQLNKRWLKKHMKQQKKAGK